MSKEIKNNKINGNDTFLLVKSGIAIAGCLINTIISDITHNNVEYLDLLHERIEVYHELLKYDLKDLLNK